MYGSEEWAQLGVLRLGLTRPSGCLTFAETWGTGLDQNTHRSKFCPNGIEAERFRKFAFFARKSPNPRLQSDCDFAPLMEAKAQPWPSGRGATGRKEIGRHGEAAPMPRWGEGIFFLRAAFPLTSRTMKEKGKVHPLPSQALHGCSSLILLPFRAELASTASRQP